MMSVAIIDTTRQFATSNNYHAFLTDLTNGQPPRLLGDQLLEASTISASITTGQNILLYGDFRRFLIIDRVGVSTEFIPNVFDQASGRPSGTRAWLMHWRVGSGIARAPAPSTSCCCSSELPSPSLGRGPARGLGPLRSSPPRGRRAGGTTTTPRRLP
jgi:hypothetical protein